MKTPTINLSAIGIGLATLVSSPVSSFAVPGWPLLPGSRISSSSAAADATRSANLNLHSRKPSNAVTLRAESDDGGSEMKDYSGAMGNLFVTVRFPAACFAGASAGAAFAPVVNAGLVGPATFGLVKRMYSLLMLSALSSQMLAIFVSSLGAFSTTVSAGKYQAESIGAFIDEHYSAMWLVTRLNFLSGLMCFIVAAGLRAWVTFDCPITAKAGVCLMISSVAMAFAFVNDGDRRGGGGGQSGLIELYTSYFKSLLGKAKKDLIFAISLIMSVAPWIFFAWNVPMLWKTL